MKILAINSSYRGEKGYTAFLIDRVFTGAKSAGAVCELVTLSTLKINRCIACNRCQTEDHFLKCIYEDKDDVKEIFNKMAESDIIIYATPVYIFNMSGLLKIFLDRFYSTSDVSDMRLTKSGLLFHHVTGKIICKPFVPLICCDNVESETPENIIRYFQTFSRFMDAPQAGLLIRQAGRLVGHGKDREKEKKYPEILDIYKAFEQAGTELATYGIIKKSTMRKTNKRIVPYLPPVRFIKKYALEYARKEMGK
ncbi:MAG: flavodoxin family protein [Candidatus Eremiobacterota bacterium]